MKRIITIIAVVLMAITANSQNIQILNKKASGTYFRGMSNLRFDSTWTIQNLSIVPDGDTYHVEWNVFNVNESEYNEIPNDTVLYTASGNFKKLSKKDGSSYQFNLKEDDVVFYTVSVSEYKIESEKYPERNSHYYIINIHYQVVTSGYSVNITIDYDDWQKMINQ